MPTPQSSHATIQSRPFGTLPSGENIELWTLSSAAGLEVEILSYGCLVRSILAPDRHGNRADLVLGYRNLEDYFDNPFCFGATVGRVAGRIAHGDLRLQGERYKLPLNDGRNHLHGGSPGFQSRVWQSQVVERPDKAPSVQFSYFSPHLENGYPGALQIKLSFTVSAANQLIIESVVESDRPTPASLAHHSFFNLAGEGSGNVLNHQLQIKSDRVIPFEEDFTLTDHFQSIKGTASDLSETKRLKDFVPKLHLQHGDLYWLDNNANLKTAAHAVEPISGRSLTAKTTHSFVQTYFATHLNGSIPSKNGDSFYEKFGGFCLECQGYPHATRFEDFGNIIVTPGTPQTHLTVYEFGVTD